MSRVRISSRYAIACSSFFEKGTRARATSRLPVFRYRRKWALYVSSRSQAAHPQRLPVSFTWLPAQLDSPNGGPSRCDYCGYLMCV
jgi:hypothetical protein